MPKIKSAEKALRQNIKRRSVNRKKKEALKKLIKNFKTACAKKEKEKAKELLVKCHKALDKAAKTNLIHKNKAARLKSRLTKLQNKIL